MNNRASVAQSSRHQVAREAMSHPIQPQQVSMSVQKLAAYDKKEVAAFWDYCLPSLRGLFLWTLWSIGITKDEAEELATDTMAAIQKRLGGFGNMTFDQVLNYAFKSAFHRASKYRKSEKRKRRLPAARLREVAPWIGPPTTIDRDGNVIEVAPCPIPPDPSQRDTERIAAQDALSKLSERDREVVYLMYIVGYSIKETALKTGLSEANVKARGSRAKKKLVAEFSKQLPPKLN